MSLPWPPELATWLAERPEAVRKVAEKIHPLGVYELTLHGSGSDYYRVAGYREPTGDEEEATVTLVRFDRASMRPTWGVFGVHAEALALIGEVNPQTGMMTFYDGHQREG